MATRKFWILAFFIMMVQLGCASKPQPSVVTEQISASATVTAIDPNRREITIHTKNYGDVTVYAGPEVRNLSQVHVGDVVTITYLQAVAAQLSTADKLQPGYLHEVVDETAPEGSSPAATRGHTVSADVQIDDIDLNTNVITFHAADGRRRVVSVQRPEVREFVKHLKVGNIVTITFVEAIAVEVRPGSA